MQLGYKNAFVLAVGAKFRFKFICRYGANFIKFMRTAINSVLEFYVAEHL